jgi:transketolase
VTNPRPPQGALASLAALETGQPARNRALVARSPYLGARIDSRVLPFRLALAAGALTAEEGLALAALEKTAARIAIDALVSLAKDKDIDHLGGGLELVPALLMTLGCVDYEAKHFAIEHGHTSIGYYAALAALGFLDPAHVVDEFRRSLDIAGHVSWVPGGTPLGSGRLGVTVPVATGLALGAKAAHGADSLVICHCGDAGWLAGQALNGFLAAARHQAPVVFVMHRNGIQLSGTTRQVLDLDPRAVLPGLGVEVLEIASLHDRTALFAAYAEAAGRAAAGTPVLIYPTGHEAAGGETLRTFAARLGITAETDTFAVAHGVALDTPIWSPGSLMSFRDVEAMLQCVFYVNGLPGGAAHHDGGMKGRDAATVLGNPMLALTSHEEAALAALRQAPAREVTTAARPAVGTPNLPLTPEAVAAIALPAAGERVSARAGSEAAYVALATAHPERCFFVSCDLDPSTKLGKAAKKVGPGHHFELGIQEQAAALIADGLASANHAPQLNVFATFAAFMEGIAREGFEFWRYQRNLTGPNEGLNVLMHFSHVGACTGRDHFSGWSLDWVTLALGYLPFLRRFYAPADATAAFMAVRDAASAMGGHIVAIPRDNLPVLGRPGTTERLWDPAAAWEPVTVYRQEASARVAILTLGAPTFMAIEAADEAARRGVPVDVYVVNGFPLPGDFLAGIAARYATVITVEDGLVGSAASGLRGFAGVVSASVRDAGVALAHFGIGDPQIAPSESYLEVWAHFGLTADAILERALAGA